MRHGQTLFNIRRKIQGACDSPLTKEGVNQANVAANYFKNEHIAFDYAYSSTQERASDTLEIITDMPYTRVKGLKEWNFGVFEGESEDLNPPRDPDLKCYGEFFVKYGGESHLEVQNRMNETLTRIMESKGHNSVLSVSHAGACFMFVRKWANMSIVEEINFSNCCILKFEYHNKEFNFIKSINP